VKNNTAILKSPVERRVLDREGFLTVRRKLTNEVQTVFTAHDTYIGVQGNPADLYVNGELSVVRGAVGVLTLPDGTDTLKSGEAIDIEKIGCYYKFNWTRGGELDRAKSDIAQVSNDLAERRSFFSSEFLRVQAELDSHLERINNDVLDDLELVSGSIENLESEFRLELDRVDASIASLVDSIAAEASVRASENSILSSSVEILRSGLSNEISVRSSENSEMRTSLNELLSINSRLKSTGLYSFNEIPVADLADPRVLTLSFEPKPAGSLLLFQNGQLLLQEESADFTVEGKKVLISQTRSLVGDDVFVATYPYTIPTVYISFNEMISFSETEGGNYIGQLENLPTNPESVMLFQNGQLLLQGEEKDFLVSQKTIILMMSRKYNPSDVMVASYPYG